jgi:hypothetical protein
MEELFSNLINRLLHEFLGLTPAINLTILFCKVNIFCSLMNYPKKLFHAYMLLVH